MTCIIRNCKNVRRLLRPDSSITFHNFPKGGELLTAWLKVLGREREDFIWSRTKFVCSDHFAPDDFKYFGNRRKLKELAVPSLHLGSESIQMGQQGPSTALTVVRSETPVFLLPVASPVISSPGKISESSSAPSPASPTKFPMESSGSESSTSRKRKRIKLEHSYMLSPGGAVKRTRELKRKYHRQSAKLYRSRESIKRLKKKVNSLSSVLKDLKSKQTLSTYAMEHLERSYGDIPNSIMSRMLKNVRSGSISTSRYPEELRKFAVTLQFYSAKAYEYVRKTFNLALPHQSTIRKWCSTVECMPGFSTLCFDVLKVKVQEAATSNRKVICNLVLDEMSIKKQIDFDGKRYWGYVDIGADLQNDEIEPAQEALVLMVVSLNSSWKLPLAYFLIKTLSGAEKANVVKEALIRLSEIDVEVTSITCDGPSAHFAMFRELGCNFRNVDNLKTYFVIPSLEDKKVYAIFDICHMLKLIRNALAVLQVFVDSEGNEIKWEFIKKLHSIQDEETLLLANKLSKKHMEWRKHQMKVNVAAQTLSNSVAEALLFLKNDLKHPDFLDCEATVDFIKRVDKLFDLMNSRLPWVKGFKGPLRIENEGTWRPFVVNCINYLLQLRNVDGNFLWTTPRKTPFLGFAISLTSMLGIFDDNVKTVKMLYLLTYKFSQDHIELFFCSIRSRNGWNNNPSCLQFMRSYKKLLLHADVSGSGGNCRVLDTTSILTVTSNAVSVKDTILQGVDIYEVRKNNQYYQDYLSSMQDHDYDVLPKLIDLTEYSQNVVAYIAGYIVKMLKKTIHCNDCIELLIEQEPDDYSYSLIKRRNLGAYIYPSKSLITICSETEMFIRRLIHLNENSLPSPDLVHDIITNVAAKLLNNLGRTIYPNHEHNYNLLKATINCYCKVRLHNLAKKYTTIFQGDAVRKKFSKLILFHHQ